MPKLGYKAPPRSAEWRAKISENMKRIHAEGKATIAKRVPLEKRFWEKVKKTEGCWGWTGSIGVGNGYGYIRINYKSKTVHRLSWEMHFGTIPRLLFVCHKCDNRKCVRPDHLFLGTCLDNMWDAVNKGRMKRKEGWISPKQNAKLTQIQVDEIRAIVPYKGMYSDLGRKYGVSYMSIRRICLGESWK